MNILRILFLALLSLPLELLNAQNLIPNSSFEENKGGYKADTSPKDRLFFERQMSHWHSCNETSPDIYNIDSLKKQRKSITVLPNTGKSFLGLAFFGGWSEVVSCPLISPLVVGRKYHFRMKMYYLPYFKDDVAYSAPNFGVTFSTEKIRLMTSRALSKNVVFDLKNKELTANQWTCVEGDFEATEASTHLILGFLAMQNTDKAVYYYIDDVELTPFDANLSPCIVNNPKIKPLAKKQAPPPPTIKKKIILENVCFETNKCALTVAAQDSLKTFLAQFEPPYKHNSNMRLQIDGHTDNKGSEEHNDDLSTKRANAVADYFVSLGLMRDILQTTGYGERKPISDNNTEEGRARNRRVEIQVLDTKTSMAEKQ